jgi:MoxR-like ATPase
MSNEIASISLILQTPKCLPALVWGDFGIGKTDRITQLVDALQWGIELYRPAERGEGGLGVVPVPSEDRKVLNYPLPDWAHRLMQDERPSVVFLDEASSTPVGLQPALMGLALDGIIAGQRLHVRIRRIAAANPIDQAAGGWELAPSLANRFVHLDWPCPSASEWVAWLMGHGDAVSAVHLDLEKWEKEWGQAKALGAAFIRSHPSALKEDVSKVLGRTPPAYATPRTWECALRLLASCRASGRMELYPMLAQGVLGPAIALEHEGGKGAWLVWLKDNDLPDPEDLLENPDLLEHDPKRPDRTFATLLAVVEAGLATANGKKLTLEKRGERWNRAWSVLNTGLRKKLGKDVVLISARTLAHAERRPRCDIGNDARAVSVELGKLIDLFKPR